MAQTSVKNIKRSATDSALGQTRCSERVMKRKMAASQSFSVEATRREDVPAAPLPVPLPALNEVAPDMPLQLGCTLGMPCPPTNSSCPPTLPGPVLGVPTYPPSKGCFPQFSCPPPAFMMFMMQRQMLMQQQMQQQALASSWPSCGLGMAAMPGFNAGMFPSVPGMDMSAANWPGMPFQPSSMTYPNMPCFQPSSQALPGMAPSPFPLTLAMTPSVYPTGQPCLPQCGVNGDGGRKAEQRNSCSATITASTHDDDRADSGHSNGTRHDDSLTDFEFATFIDSFLTSGATDTPQAPHTGDAALDLHLDLSDLVKDVEGEGAADDGVNLHALLETMA